MNLSKDLIAASSTPLVLGILTEGESYGYESVKRVGELSGGTLQWTDGMLYPLLHRLEHQALLKSIWRTADTGRKRKYYHITAKGHKTLAEQSQQWEAINKALEKIWRNLNDRSNLAGADL